MEIMERDIRTPVPFDPDGAVRDHIVVLHQIPWEQYVALNDARGEGSHPRFAYLDGELEIMTTSERHELVKTMIARLVEAFAEEMKVSLNGYGNTTWRKKAKRAGIEPDECYVIGRLRKVPDLAIEVVHTSGGIDKLELYRRLGIAEVWFWINGRIYVYRLDRKYKEVPASVVLPSIDLDAIARIITGMDEGEQTEVVRTYRRSLRVGAK
jgi:Uma2 family endonuclease